MVELKFIIILDKISQILVGQMFVNLHMYIIHNCGMYMDTKCSFIANFVDAIRSKPILLSNEVVSSIGFAYTFSQTKNICMEPSLL